MMGSLDKEDPQRLKAALLAEQMMGGRLDLLEGCRRLVELSPAIGPLEIMNYFIATDAAAADLATDAERARFVEDEREEIVAACTELVDGLNDQTE